MSAIKKYLSILLIVLCVTLGSQAYAYNLNKMTDNQTILSALKVLEDNGQTDVLDRIEKKQSF